MNRWEDKTKRITHDKFVGKLYPFQHQGVTFLALVKNCLLTDATGLGKTVELIAAYDLLRTKYPKRQAIIVTMASTQIQWAEFFKKFMPGIHATPLTGNAAERTEIYRKFGLGEVDVIVLNYSLLARDSFRRLPKKNPNDKKEKARYAYDNILPKNIFVGKGLDYLFVLDEIQKCKNNSSLTGRAAQRLANLASGVKGMTATPVYTHLIDLFGIFKIIDPSVFQTKQAFKEEYCILDYTFSVWGSISGYKNHEKIKERLKGFVFGRTKAEVAVDLPDLVTKDVYVDLPEFHQEVYQDLEDRIDLNDPDEKVSMIASMVNCQVCANVLENVKDYSGKRESHPKIDEVVRIIQEDLVGEKILVYSRYVETLNILQKELNFVDFGAKWRIFGVDCIEERDRNLKAWEKSTGTSVMMITGAGGAGLNLQAASTLILIDRPWSPGELAQIRGRIHRIGTQHKNLLEINIIARGTIDEYVLESLRDKEQNITQVFGESDKPLTIDEILKKREQKNKANK